MSKVTARPRLPIEEESDDASVGSNTTEEAEQEEKSYHVDKILAESHNHEGSGETKYLLKWEGYEDHWNTWEPRDHIESPVLFDQWEETKVRIRSREEVPFDLEGWNAMMLKRWEDSCEKARRRKNKRRRRGIPVSSSEDECEGDEVEIMESPKRKRLPRRNSYDEDIGPAPTSSKRKVKAGTSSVKRKGIAQKVSNTSRAIAASSDEDDEEPLQSSMANSLFDEGSQPIYPELSTPAVSVAKPKPKKAPFIRPPTSIPKVPKPAAASRTEAPPSRPTVPPAPTTSKATGQAIRSKPSTNIFASFGDTSKKPRQRARVSGETSKTLNGPKFQNLSKQNRFQKYGRNEPAPDPSALAVFDGKTGLFEPAKTAPAPVTAPSRKGTGEIHSAYSRARSPPRFERRRSITPPAPIVTVPEPPTGPKIPPSLSIAPSGRRRTETCIDWQLGSCSFSAADCSYAHFEIEPTSAALTTTLPAAKPWVPPSGTWAPKEDTTCYFWLQDEGCPMPEDVCLFSHSFTGTFPQRALKEPELIRRVTETKNTPCPAFAIGACIYTENQCKMAHRLVGKKALTCFFWSKGNCRRHNTCPYSHFNTGQMAEAPPGWREPSVERIVAEPPPGYGGLREPSGLSSAMSPTDDRANKTCWFWDKGACSKGDNCPFVHGWTGLVADCPPSYRGPREPNWRGRPTNTSPLEPSTMPYHMATPFMTPPPPPPHPPPPPPPPPMDSYQDHIMQLELPQGQQMPDLNMDQGIIPATLQLFGATSTKVMAYVDLHVSGKSQVEELFYPVARGVYLMPDSMITAKDVQRYLADQVLQSNRWPTGSIVPGEVSRKDANDLVDCCKLHASALVSIQDAFTLLVYPTRDDEWRFLDRQDAQVVNAPLRFQFLPPIRTGRMSTIVDTLSGPLRAPVAAAKSLLNIDAPKLLSEKPSSNVFLAWPNDHEAELEVLIKCFQDLNCKVYHSGTPGAWHYFRKTHKSCLILVHPTTPLWEIPKLYEVLRNGSVRVFSVGMQRFTHQSLDAPESYGCERIFPLGTVTFITDDVFVNHPDSACKVIRRLLKNNSIKGKPVGAMNDKFATRPGVKDWLCQLAMEKATEAAEAGRPDDRWLQAYLSLCELCPPKDEDPFDLPNPLPHSYLVSFPPEELPSYSELWDRDPEQATDMMVEWFAGWSLCNAKQFRKFLICHESQKGGRMVTDESGQSNWQAEADPRGWSKKWQHCDVQLPSQILKS
ncbi:hypothetical protein LTR17_027119 [Elasticomyces elasticus]|nr:hypothetical protein LTR17_027119 [Elasticomyces elasticus]